MLWTEICEIKQIFKGDLIKFCEILQKSLELSQSGQKPLFKFKKLVINTTKCDLCLFLHKMCCKNILDGLKPGGGGGGGGDLGHKLGTGVLLGLLIPTL